MSTTLSYVGGTVTLADDFLWPDEFAWAQVQQAREYSLTGALVVQAAAKLTGRPITLRGTEQSAWMPRSALNTLLAMKALPGQQFTLLYRGVSRTVMFDQEAGAVEAAPVIDYSDPADDDVYTVTLRFIEI